MKFNGKRNLIWIWRFFEGNWEDFGRNLRVWENFGRKLMEILKGIERNFERNWENFWKKLILNLFVKIKGVGGLYSKKKFDRWGGQRSIFWPLGTVHARGHIASTSAGRADVDAMSCHVARSRGRDFDVDFTFRFTGF